MRTLFDVSHYHLWCRCFHKRNLTNWENPNKNNRQPYGTIVLLEAHPQVGSLGVFLNTRNKMEAKDIITNILEEYNLTIVQQENMISDLANVIVKDLLDAGFLK